MYKAIITDMDGTILNSQSKLSEENINAILEIQKNNLDVVLASGRPIGAMISMAKKINSKYMISYNGTVIYDVVNDKILSKQMLSKDKVKKMFDLANSIGVGIVAYNNDIIYCNQFDEYVNIEVKYTGLNYKVARDYNDEAFKCMIITHPDKVKQLLDQLSSQYSEEYTFSISDPHFLEITVKNVDKGIAFTKLCDILGIDAKQTIVVGDSYNDLPMLLKGGLKLAPLNAKDDIKKICNKIICSNNDNIMVDIQKILQSI